MLARPLPTCWRAFWTKPRPAVLAHEGKTAELAFPRRQHHHLIVLKTTSTAQQPFSQYANNARNATYALTSRTAPLPLVTSAPNFASIACATRQIIGRVSALLHFIADVSLELRYRWPHGWHVWFARSRHPRRAATPFGPQPEALPCHGCRRRQSIAPPAPRTFPPARQEP